MIAWILFLVWLFGSLVLVLALCRQAKRGDRDLIPPPDAPELQRGPVTDAFAQLSEAQRELANATGAAAASEAFATMAARIAALGTSHDREA